MANLNIPDKTTGDQHFAAEYQAMKDFIDSPLIDMGDGTFRMYYNGLPDGVPTYKTGFATTSDGLTWTKYASNPIVTDANTFFIPYKDGLSWYAIAKQGSQHKVYTSNNGISWIFARNITLTGCRFITDIFKFGSTFYCYGYSDGAAYSDIYEKCFATTNFITFTDLGNTLTKFTSSTKGLGHNCMLQTGQYSFAYFYSYYKYRTRLERVGVENPLMSIRCATLTNSVPWATTFRANFPAYVKRFYSVCDSDFRSVIGNASAINQPASPSYSTDELYLELNGTTDYVEYTESTLPSNLDYSLKMRVYKNLTGTQPLFTYANECVYVGLSSGKLEVKLKNNAGTLVKHYVSVDDVDIPATARDVYTGAWIGFIFQDSTLKLYINNFEVTTTKTVDSVIDSIYNQSSNNAIIGKNGSTFSDCSIRNITIMSGETEEEYINWDMM